MTEITIKRVYEKPSPTDGFRILVDRLWPRGISKENAHIDQWNKDIAPSTELRKWFNHDPEKWDAFSEKYLDELKANNVGKTFWEQYKNQKKITLVFGAKDTQHCNSVVLLGYLKSFQK